jgi:hypothetical protein
MYYRGPAFSPSYDLAPSPIPFPLIRKFIFVKTSRNLQWQVKKPTKQQKALKPTTHVGCPCILVKLRESIISCVRDYRNNWAAIQLV